MPQLSATLTQITALFDAPLLVQFSAFGTTDDGETLAVNLRGAGRLWAEHLEARILRNNSSLLLTADGKMQWLLDDALRLATTLNARNIMMLIAAVRPAWRDYAADAGSDAGNETATALATLSKLLYPG